MRSASIRLLLSFVFVFVPSAAFAHGVTLSGTSSFSSLDGSSADHDGAVNGVFTVSDGDLTIDGIINCNDDSGDSACSMAFNASGDIIVNGALYAENRSGGGSGGAITLTAGRDLIVGTAGIVSTASKSSSGAAGGNITATVARHVTLSAGSTIDSGAANAKGGNINVTAGGVVTVDGNVLSGPSRTLLATRLTGAALDGGTANQVGGEIRIASNTFAEPAILIGSAANVVSQGETTGAGPVTIDGCGVVVKGLVAALSKKDSPSKVSIRSGKDILIDARDLGVAGATLGRNGRVRADAPTGTAIAKGVDIIAAETIDILGPLSASSSMFPITSLAGLHDSKSVGGLIRVLSTGEGINASGNVADDGRAAAGDTGGPIEISAKGNINLDTAVILSYGDSSTNNPARGGGSIKVRSHSGNIVWTNGVGDVRPTGSASSLPLSDQGTISLTACGTVTTTGSSFPVNGSPTGVWPAGTTGSCSPAAPALPAGMPALVTCNTPPVANDASASTNEDQSVTITLSGTDADGDSLTFSIVSGPSNGSLSSYTQLTPTTASIIYTGNPNFNGADSFVYQANDGNGGTDTATVSITVAPVNDAPSFLAGPTAISLEDAGPQSYANWATAISAGPADEAGQTVTFTVSNSNPSLFSVQPAVAPNGTLTYTAASNAYGTATLTVTAQDNGGTANGGSNTSASQTSSISITPVNDAPSFTGGGNVVVAEDSGSYSAAWASAISAGPNESQNVAFSASNSNNALFSIQPAVSPTGVLTFTLASNASGSATVSVTLSDDGGTANGGVDTSAAQSFTITVNSVNDAPSFTSGGNVTVLEDSGAYSAAWATAVSAGPADESGQSLTFSVTNDNGSLFSVPPAISPSGVLSFTLNANAFGSANVTVTLSDNGGTANGGADTSAPQTFVLTVSAVNDAPSFTAGGNVSLAEDAAAYSAAWASGISAGPGEGGQSVSFNVSNSNNALFSVQPAISPSGVLTFTLAANANGSASVTVTLSDNGGTANGGVDTSAAQSFTINVSAVNDPPSFTKGADQTVLEDSGAHSVSGWATAISAGPADESGQSVSFIISATNASLFAALPSVNSNGDLTFAVASNAFGSSTVTITAQDDAGGTSASQTFTITVTPVNDAPSFVAGGNVTANEDAGPQSMAWASSIFAGPNEGGQTLSFNVLSNSNPSLFSVAPSISPAGVLTFTSAPNAFGSATITVNLTDNGGTANGGVDTSSTASFTINVAPVNDPPVAAADAWDTVGNTLLQVAASKTVTGAAVFTTGSVLSNDSDIDSPGSLTATVIAGSVTPGAIVTMASDGTFTYLPPAGHPAATDSFSYTVSDGSASSTGTVTISLKGRVWYVRNDGAAGTGRSTDSFATLAAAESASTAGDTVFIYTGNGTVLNQNSGFVLQNGQRLLGQGVALTVPVSVNGGPNPTVLLAAGAKPAISNAAGDGVTGSAVSNVEVAGLQITGSLNGGIALANASMVKVSTVTITGNLGSGISGNTVNGFALDNAAISGNGDVATESQLVMFELTGSASVTNSTFSGSVRDNVRIANTVGSLNRLTFDGCTFGLNATATGDDNVTISGVDGVLNVTVEDSVFSGARGDQFQLNLAGPVTSDLVFQRNNLTNTHTNSVGGGVSISGGGLVSPTLTYNVTGNSISGARGSALTITRGSGAGSFSGTVHDNSIGVSGVANSGSLTGSGIFASVVGGGSHTVAITNNRIYQYNNHGIFLQAGNATSGGNGALNATVTGNTVAQPASASFPQNGFQLNAGVSSTGPDAHNVCLNLSNNTLTLAGKNGGTDFLLRQRFSTTVRLPGYVGANNNNAAVVAFVQANNVGSASGSATNTVPTGGGFVGGAGCIVP